VTVCFVIRPEPGCSATVEAAAALGLAAIAAPLFEVVPVPWDRPEGDFDGLLAGSANLFRYGGTALDSLRHLPVLAVGQATANAAEATGFEVERIGSGGLQGLLDGLPDAPRHLLRLSGSERIALYPPAAIAISACEVYRVDLLPVSDHLAYSLRKGGTVLVHSALAARHFASECDRMAINRATIELAAIGPRVADACGAGWRTVASADQPNDTALLALARSLCQ
jgi:uroporphyrinogen-III synthase